MNTTMNQAKIANSLMINGEALAKSSGLSFNINDNAIANVIRNYMVNHGQDIPVKDILDNKQLLESYKLRLYSIKGKLAMIKSRLTTLESSAATNLAFMSAITLSGITVAATAVVANSGPATTLGEAINDTLGKGAFNSAKDNYLLQIDSLFFDLQDVFGQAAEMSLSLPTEVESYYTRIQALKSTILTMT